MDPREDRPRDPAGEDAGKHDARTDVLTARDRLIVALDVPSVRTASALADSVGGVARWFKIGPELFLPAGPAGVAELATRGRIFLDLKFHDIPATVQAAVAGAARLGVEMLTVHALGGRAMLEAARRAAAGASSDRRTRVVAVTVLTSGDPAALRESGIDGTPAEAALRLARLARSCSLDGVVASPLEAPAIRASCGRDFLIVCPGIRPAASVADDQRRVAAPAEAVRAGADMLVVGRPITRAGDPRAAAEAIVNEMRDALDAP